jgi:hypothetical protein
MERVHYRRVTTSQGPARPAAQGGGLKERLITQAVVSALVLAFAIAVSVLEHPYSAQVRNGISRVFEGYTDANALMADINKLGGAWLDPTENAVASPAVSDDAPPLPDALQPPVQMPTTAPEASKSTAPEASDYPEP